MTPWAHNRLTRARAAAAAGGSERLLSGLVRAGLRGRGLGREITRLVLSWAFGVLGMHRVELEALAGNIRAIRCYQACGFRHEGIRREVGLYPDGWKDFTLMGELQPEYAPTERTAPAGGPPSA